MVEVSQLSATALHAHICFLLLMINQNDSQFPDFSLKCQLMALMYFSCSVTPARKNVLVYSSLKGLHSAPVGLLNDFCFIFANQEKLKMVVDFEEGAVLSGWAPTDQ